MACYIPLVVNGHFPELLRFSARVLLSQITSRMVMHRRQIFHPDKVVLMVTPFLYMYPCALWGWGHSNKIATCLLLAIMVHTK